MANKKQPQRTLHYFIVFDLQICTISLHLVGKPISGKVTYSEGGVACVHVCVRVCVCVCVCVCMCVGGCRCVCMCVVGGWWMCDGVCMHLFMMIYPLLLNLMQERALL